MDDIVLARVLHVLAVIHWIGGVSFVTLVVLPLAGRQTDQAFGRALFTMVERRFSQQVAVSLPLAGVTGLWMCWRSELWSRFSDPHYWWMSAMAGLWLIFMLLIFVLEPRLHQRFVQRLEQAPDATYRRLTGLHIGLLSLSAVTILGVVGGAQGYFLF